MVSCLPRLWPLAASSHDLGAALAVGADGGIQFPKSTRKRRPTLRSTRGTRDAGAGFVQRPAIRRDVVVSGGGSTLRGGYRAIGRTMLYFNARPTELASNWTVFTESEDETDWARLEAAVRMPRTAVT